VHAEHLKSVKDVARTFRAKVIRNNIERRDKTENKCVARTDFVHDYRKTEVQSWSSVVACEFSRSCLVK
jgi:hypothetical protein